MPFVEAMASNMPIVASDTPWAREVCGPAAAYADPREPREWADAIEDLVARGSRQNVEGVKRLPMFDWMAAAEKYARLLVR